MRQERKKNKVMREEREKRKENKNNKTFTFSVRMLSFLRWYCSLMPNILTFRTPDVSGFLVFGMPNAKYLAFNTPDRNALICNIYLEHPWYDIVCVWVRIKN